MLRLRLMAALYGLPLIAAFLTLNWWLRTTKGGPLQYDDLPMLAMVLIIAVASGWEISHVVAHRMPGVSLWNGVYAAIIVPLVVHSVRQIFFPGVNDPHGPGSLGIFIDTVGSSAAFMLLFLGVWSDAENRGWRGLKENAIVIGAGLYVGISCSALLLLVRLTPLHELGLAMVIVGVIALDTAAYFGGRYLGGKLLWPAVSPNKTWAGAICGLSFTVILALGYGLLPKMAEFPAIGPKLGLGALLVLGLTIGLLGQVGDFAESLFKRWAGVKDSGNAIVGHGGFLDRFDSMFLVAPIAYLMLVAFLHAGK